MDNDDDVPILVTSPKKKVHYVNGKLVRQMSADMGPMLAATNGDDDDDDSDYVEEVIESDEDCLKTLILLRL